MKKKGFSILIILILLLSIVSTVAAEDETHIDGIAKDSHKIRNKWDLSGSFIGCCAGGEIHNWDGLAHGAIWNYDIHVKEAMDGNLSKGSVHFSTISPLTGELIDVVGNVEKAVSGVYWLRWEEALLIVGTANYNDTEYYFSMIYGEIATYFTLHELPYAPYWILGQPHTSSGQPYSIHSITGTDDFPVDYKEIHTD